MPNVNNAAWGVYDQSDWNNQNKNLSYDFGQKREKKSTNCTSVRSKVLRTLQDMLTIYFFFSKHSFLNLHNMFVSITCAQHRNRQISIEKNCHIHIDNNLMKNIAFVFTTSYAANTKHCLLKIEPINKSRRGGTVPTSMRLNISCY